MGDSQKGSLGERGVSRDQWSLFFGDAAGVFQATATAGAKTHLLGDIIQGHALRQALFQLAAVDVLTDTNDHVANNK